MAGEKLIITSEIYTEEVIEIKMVLGRLTLRYDKKIKEY